LDDPRAAESYRIIRFSQTRRGAVASTARFE
jgi:hypothetical protein